MTEIKGIHPYIADLPIFEGKVDEIAESIDEVGLLHKITLDTEGNVIGGRHRLEACEVAGIEPEFETYDGDPLAFMLHDNDARKHQTTGQLAAEKALTLDSAGCRINNRWKRGSVDISDSANTAGWKDRMKEVGIILDFLGRGALTEVALGSVVLSAQFGAAMAKKEHEENAERERMELAKREEREEEEARQFFIDNNDAGKWLADRPGQHKTLASAYAQYEAENKEVRLEAERRRREEEARERERVDALKRDVARLKAFLTGYGQAWGMRTHPDRDEVLNMLDPTEKKRFITIEKELAWPPEKN